MAYINEDSVRESLPPTKCLHLDTFQKNEDSNIGTHHTFIEYKAAYDSTNRSELHKAVEALNIPTKLTRLAKPTTEDRNCCVRIKSDLSVLIHTH